MGGTDQNDALVWSSSYGNFVDLVAPGTGIVTSDRANDSAYVTVEGTSYAGPLVSGVCAMIWSQRPNLSPNDVERILKASADDIGTPGVDQFFGYGRINLAQALLNSWDEAPVADFAAPAPTGVSPLPVTFTDLSTGVPTTWSWDFGDGGTSTLQNPTHTYLTSGTFTVTLTVDNAFGSDTATKTDLVLVDVIPPVADFAASVTGGLSPLDVDFTDQSTGGVPTSWLWDFGDGATSTLQNPSHTYTASGFQTVSLTVTNPYGSDTLTRTDYVAVDFIPPVASFSGTPVSAASPFVTTFTDESTGGVATSWSWSFGDGYGSTAQNPAHTYTVAGTYSVSLTASNAYGADTLWRTDYIEVLPGPTILADFVGAPTTGTTPLHVDFTDQSVGHIISWEWNFGDGAHSTLQHPSHVFTSPDEEYDIALTVTNADGKDSDLELQAYITTTEASSSVPPVPDGAWVPGTQLLAGRNLADPNLVDVTWDATSCPAIDYNIYYGDLGGFDVVVGGICDLGTTGAATVTIPGNATWWVIDGQDGEDFVGSHGRDSTGAERILVNWDLTCAQTQLDLTGTCP